MGTREKMAKSLRSKWKRKMRAEKRVRYGAKERAKLEKMCAAAKEREVAELKTASEIREAAMDSTSEIREDAMDSTSKSGHSQKTYKNEHGNYPKWMSRKKIEKQKKINNKKKILKKTEKHLK